MSIAAPDPVSSILHSALDGLSLRQRVIADNIANVDTPNFRSTSVDFESSLRSAILDGTITSGRTAPTTAPTDTPVGANGNNVDLRKETLAAMQSTFQYQMISRAVTDRNELVKAVVTGI